MIFTLRYKDVKAACGKAVNLGPSDTRLFDYVNRAVERLLYSGKWKGTVQTFRFCVSSDSCVVWPREIETPEAIAIDNTPAKIRSAWYEFVENGSGIIDCDSDLSKTLIDRGEVCAFDEVVGSNKKLAVYCDRNEAAGKYINLQFYNASGQWVSSAFNGEVIEGEQVAIPTVAGTYNYTSSTCKAGGLVRVKKDVTLGIVRLYSYDTTTGALKPLAYYQPDEEVPVYRRSLIPCLQSSGCDQTPIVVVAKLRFVPVSTDESFVMISHREALRLACRAILQEECDNWNEANINWATAYRLLNEQLSHYHGQGEANIMQAAPPSVWGGGISVIV